MSEQEKLGSLRASSAGVNAPAKVPAAGCDESVRESDADRIASFLDTRDARLTARAWAEGFEAGNIAMRERAASRLESWGYGDIARFLATKVRELPTLREVPTSQPAAETSIAPVPSADEAPGEPIASASSPPASTGERGGDGPSLRDAVVNAANFYAYHWYVDGSDRIGAAIWEKATKDAALSGERSPRAGTAVDCGCGRGSACPYGDGAPPPRSSGTTARWLCTKCGNTTPSERFIGRHPICGEGGCGKYLMRDLAEPSPAPVAGAVSGQGGER